MSIVKAAVLRKKRQMEIENEEKNSKLKIMIGTPCYGGMCSAEYTNSLINTKTYLEAQKIKFGVCFIVNESLVPRARNTIVANFLSDPSNTHLMFIDADVRWNDVDIYKLIIHDKDIVGGVYPMKNYEFGRLQDPRIKELINHESPLNFSDINYIKANLMKYTVNANSESSQLRGNLANVDKIATGFMLIKRNVLVEMCKYYPKDKYDDDLGLVTPEQNEHLFALFNCEIVENSTPGGESTRRYLSEDYNFCRKWKEMDEKNEIHLDLSINLSHFGSHRFDGNPFFTMILSPKLLQLKLKESEKIQSEGKKEIEFQKESEYSKEEDKPLEDDDVKFEKTPEENKILEDQKEISKRDEIIDDEISKGDEKEIPKEDGTEKIAKRKKKKKNKRK